MPGFDAAFCKTLEIEYMGVRKALDLIVTYPEQFADKIRSFCYRLANIVFKAILNEIGFWRDQIVAIKDILLNSKIMKNTKKICADMMRCKVIFELVANKPFFGNKSKEELEADAVKFQQYVCNGKILEALVALVDAGVNIINGFVSACRTYIKTVYDVWIADKLQQYKLWIAPVREFFEKMDKYADCVFGLCSIGVTVRNQKEDLMNRLHLNVNGQINTSKFLEIIEAPVKKIESGLSNLEQGAANLQNNATYRKVVKSTLAH